MNSRYAVIFLAGFLFTSQPAMAEKGSSKAVLTSRAMHGDVQSQYDLCRFYQKEKSNDFAASWCEKSAMAGNLPAQLQLAWLTLRNAENQDDIKKGYIWLSVALAQEYDFSGYNEWKKLSARFSNDKKAFKRLERETNKFFKKYVRPLEKRHVSELITESKARYIAWLKQRAEKGNAEAQALMGVIYEYDGDFARAFEWYRKSAQGGYVDAQAYLGRSMPDDGIGAFYDDDERYAWMSVALSQHYNYVDKLSLSLLSKKLGKDRLAKAQQTAAQYYKDYIDAKEWMSVPDLIKRAEDRYMQKLIDNATLGSGALQDDFAQKYKSGIDVLKDTTKSMEWHMKSAQGGSIIAQYTLGHMYEVGIERSKNTVQAAKWYKKAAMQGYRPAQFALGQLYFKNIKEGESNIIEAYAWLDIATKQGHPSADIARDAIAKSFDAEEIRLAGILSRKYYRQYVEPFQEDK